MVKPGVHWDSIHLHSHRVLVDGLLALGVVKGDAEAILQSGITCAFYPHGLGHSLGLDVHDSRQYLRSTQVDIPDSSKQTPAKLYTYLRIRQPLLEGMVLTVEPGCYFPPQLMEEHGVWTSEYVDHDILKRYIPVGGVRIEDAVVVRADGMENLTTAPRERKEIEALCSGEA
jgi:Xaa-Pro dipeptidase